jgi:hypothetical protein
MAKSKKFFHAGGLGDNKITILLQRSRRKNATKLLAVLGKKNPLSMRCTEGVSI